MTEDADLDFSDIGEVEGDNSILQTRAMLALSGNFLGGPQAVKIALVEFLKSEAAITPRIRSLLANTIERGGNRQEQRNGAGFAMPSLTVEGLGADGDLGAKILERRRWFEIGEAIYQEIGSTRPKSGELDRAIDRVKSRPKMAFGSEALKKYWGMYRAFMAAKDSPEMQSRVADLLGRPVVGEIDRLAYYESARTIFIEDRARTMDKAWQSVRNPNRVH